jgi:hypothetical protein
MNVNDNLPAHLRGGEIRALRREFSTALATLHVLGQDLSSNLGILKLSQEFSSDLRLRNLQAASEDDVIHELRRVFSATSTVFLELRRGNLRLRSGQFVVELLLHIQQVGVIYCHSKFIVGQAPRLYNLPSEYMLQGHRYLDPPILGVQRRLRSKRRHPDSQNPHR